MKKNVQNSNFQIPNTNKGITLVALVITIIVLLILAGVAINMAINSDGLFGKANEAAEGWETARQEEQSEIQKLLDKLGVDTPTEISEEIPANWDSAKVDKVVIQGTRKAPIPKGFTLSGITGDMPENTINKGLVIYQTGDVNTDADGFWTNKGADGYLTCQTTYNQYVWIPVDDINQMVMCKSNNVSADTNGNKICNIKLINGVLQCTNTAHITTKTDLCGRLYGTDYSREENGYTCKTSMNFEDRTQNWTQNDWHEPDILSTYYDNEENTGGLVSFTEQMMNDFVNMVTSVANYGGFYIGRYEAGLNGESKKNQIIITADKNNTQTRTGVKMWYGLYNEVHNEIVVGTSIIQSHMIYGSQYDQIINFLEKNSGNEPQKGHDEDEFRSLKLTGTYDFDNMNNIYDLEGNSGEWTAQACSTSARTLRGGDADYAYNHNFYSASHSRDLSPTNYKYNYAQFTTRASLYF